MPPGTMVESWLVLSLGGGGCMSGTMVLQQQRSITTKFRQTLVWAADVGI